MAIYFDQPKNNSEKPSVEVMPEKRKQTEARILDKLGNYVVELINNSFRLQFQALEQLVSEYLYSIRQKIGN